MTNWPTNPGSKTQSVHYGAGKLGEHIIEQFYGIVQ
ncbi:MAG: hypothetical protein UV20_C0021G0005 [Candidatus Magasanikbacteria bacterium GW2011_GWA2_42_32]|uniref:Uncharacterized protein n=1 Tax=Candidatus Magasanikbacteria bacterium GW2011_GWA2_42_32 TaxID=1619039 RepID=A0A0G1A4G7_9BACT|nr:MAG: hypothetical protein UV20_C0021G0005 [Candidatus Magasanikbacteria bacterium GW2011_GWA2_42_32]